mgnify:CR=1 FL=1
MDGRRRESDVSPVHPHPDRRSPLVFEVHELARRAGTMKQVVTTVPAPADMGTEVIGVPQDTDIDTNETETDDDGGLEDAMNLFKTVRPNIVQSIRAFRVADLAESATSLGQHFLYANCAAATTKAEVLDVIAREFLFPKHF